MEHSRSDGLEMLVLPHLFSMVPEEILQMIFLYLDPKSLKNSKQTCQQWKDVIDRRIWGSSSGRKVLNQRLVSNWKNPTSAKIMDRIRLDHVVDNVACDKQVMVFWNFDGRITAASSSSHEILYSIRIKAKSISIGESSIATVSTGQVTIFDKFTGRIEYQEPEGNELSSLPDPVVGKEYTSLKMMKNDVFVSQSCGNIMIFSKDDLTNWISREWKTGLQYINLMFGDESFDVLGYGSRQCIKFWDRSKEVETDLGIDKSELLNVEDALLSYPFVFIIFNGDEYGLYIKYIKIYNVVTKECIRSLNYSYHCRDIQIDGNFVSITNEKLIVFDLKEVTNKDVANEDLWQREFEGHNILGAPIISKMLVVRYNRANIYDFWGDRDCELTEEEDDNDDSDDSHDSDSDNAFEFDEYSYSED